MTERKGIYRKQQSRIPLPQLELTLPENLELYLNDREILILKGMLANYTIRDIAADTCFRRSDIMEYLIDLGRALQCFELCERRIIPDRVDSADYLKGFNACKKIIRREIHDKSWRQTIKDGNK